MASVTVVQPKSGWGHITTLSSSQSKFTVRWDPPSGYDPEDFEFNGFSLYCHACGQTIVETSTNPGVFDLTSLEHSGHPGPFEISVSLSSTWSLRLTTESMDPAHGSTSPAQVFRLDIPVGGSVSVTIKATPVDGYKFDHWDCPDRAGWSSTYSSITISTTCRSPGEIVFRTYRAYFVRKSYTIKTIPVPAEGGTTSPSSQVVYQGDSVEISATANEGYAFVRWDDKVEDPVREIEVHGSHTFHAFFVLLSGQYTLTLDVSRHGGVNIYQCSVYPETQMASFHSKVGIHTSSGKYYFVFWGWSTSEDEISRIIATDADADILYSWTTNTHLFALWTPSSVIDIEIQGGGSASLSANRGRFLELNVPGRSKWGDEDRFSGVCTAPKITISATPARGWVFDHIEKEFGNPEHPESWSKSTINTDTHAFMAYSVWIGSYTYYQCFKFKVVFREVGQILYGTDNQIIYGESGGILYGTSDPSICIDNDQV